MIRPAATSAIPILLSTILATAAFGDVNYSIQPLSSAGTAIAPLRINDQDQTTGYGLGVSPYPALIAQNGTTQIIPLGQIGFASANDINNHGLTVGFAEFPDVGQRAYEFNGTTVTFLNTPTGQSSAAAINNSGVIAGVITVNGDWNAATWTNRNFTDLDSNPNEESQAIAINKTGVVAGYAADGPDPDSHPRPVIWQNGQMTDLGTLGGPLGKATDINDHNIVVGGSITSDGKGRAFEWNAGTMFNLGVLPNDTESDALAINDAGTIVGSSSNGGQGNATLWTGNQIINLNTLLPANSGWDLTEADDINNQGQIVGLGTFDGVQSGFLLSPDTLIAATVNQIALPEPTTGLLLLASRPFLQSLRRRRRATSNLKRPILQSPA
jgi:probable HAF family extracellular repeat protein